MLYVLLSAERSIIVHGIGNIFETVFPKPIRSFSPHLLRHRNIQITILC